MRIRPATLDEAHACARVIAGAMLHDPVGVRATPGTHRRLSRMTSLYEAELLLGAFAHGRVDVAIVDDRIAGVAAWIAPHPRVGIIARMRQAPRYAYGVGPVHAIHAIRMRRIRHRARPTEPHWLLADIAVADDVRGSGVGSALLAHGLERCDGPVLLEATTAASERLYARHGFTPRTRIGIAPGGFPVTMWRAPEPPSPR